MVLFRHPCIGEVVDKLNAGRDAQVPGQTHVRCFLRAGADDLELCIRENLRDEAPSGKQMLQAFSRVMAADEQYGPGRRRRFLPGVARGHELQIDAGGDLENPFVGNALKAQDGA